MHFKIKVSGSSISYDHCRQNHQYDIAHLGMEATVSHFIVLVVQIEAAPIYLSGPSGKSQFDEIRLPLGSSM
jgi:hypothetical protein